MSDPRPADVPWLTPYLTVRDARVSTGFYEQALGFGCVTASTTTAP